MADQRARYWQEPEAHRKRMLAWQREHLDYAADAARDYRARKASVFVEHVDSLVVLERDDGVCGICGDDVDPLDFHVDHVEPLAEGGLHAYFNVQVAHPRCNVAKGARVL